MLSDLTFSSAGTRLVRTSKTTIYDCFLITDVNGWNITSEVQRRRTACKAVSALFATLWTEPAANFWPKVKSWLKVKKKATLELEQNNKSYKTDINKIRMNGQFYKVSLYPLALEQFPPVSTLTL